MKLLLPLLALVFLTACGTAAAQTEPDTYLVDIRAEATRTSVLNDRTEALLEGNEALQATAIAAYVDLGSDWAGLEAMRAEMETAVDHLEHLLSNPVVDQSTVDALLILVDRLTSEMDATVAAFAPTPLPTPVPPTPVVIVQPVPADLNALSEAEMRQVACQLLTIEYVDNFPGFGPATAQDLRTNLGC